jgi:hypothetical protein
LIDFIIRNNGAADYYDINRMLPVVCNYRPDDKSRKDERNECKDCARLSKS